MRHQQKTIYVTSFIAVLLALYCYNPVALYFQNDDFIHIPLSAQGRLLQQNTFRPVCDISIMPDYLLWHKNAWGYHLTNLLLHIIACVLVFHLSKKVLDKFFQQRKAFFTCWLSSVLFFVYAMHSEPVLWILGRSAILAAIFSLLFLYCYLRKNESVIFITGFIVSWVLCLLTYESTWVLPVFCVYISAVSVRQNRAMLKKEVLHITVITAIFIAFLVVRSHYIHQVTGSYESSLLLNGDIGLLLKHYVLLFIRSFVPAFINNKILIAAFAVFTLVIVWLFISRQKNKKATLRVFVCFMVSLLPYISLGIDTNGTESERFLYFPTVIVVILFATVIHAAAARKTKLYFLYPWLFTIHIITLFVVTDNYRTAGNIIKQISEALKQAPNKKAVYASEVPQAQNGAFILRQGLPQMMHWLCKKNPDTVVICSQRYELLPLEYPYKIIYSDTLSMQCSNGPNIIKSSRDTMLLKFTGSALYISK